MEKIRVRRDYKRLPLYESSGSPLEDILRLAETAEAEGFIELKFTHKKRTSYRGMFNGYELILTGMRLETDTELDQRKIRESDLLKARRKQVKDAQKELNAVEKSLGIDKCKHPNSYHFHDNAPPYCPNCDRYL